MDAAIAAAAVLGVVEPAMTGIGGDCFVLMSVGGSDRILAYNGAGRAARARHPDWFRDQRIDKLDPDSIHAITVPGAVEAWCRLAKDHGKLGLDQLLRPAIHYAEEGFPVSPRVAADWAEDAPRLARNPAAAKQYLPGGSAPKTGDIVKLPLLGKALREIIWKGAAGFYEGWVAEDIVNTVRAEGSLLRLQDLAEHRGGYVMPIKTSYRGLDVWQCPPPGQGLTALIMLNILSQFPMIGAGPLTPDRLHLEIEAGKLAYLARDRHIADPDHAEIPLEKAALDGACTRPRRADPPQPRARPASGAAAATASRHDLSDRGRSRPQRGQLHQLDLLWIRQRAGDRAVRHPAAEPRRLLLARSRASELHRAGQALDAHDHPRLVTSEGKAALSFGVMGGDYQPMGQVHALTNMVDFGLDAQAALDCARVHHEDGLVGAETGIPEDVFLGLADRGHKMMRLAAPLGGGQAIAIDWQRGVLLAGSDPRKDGCALGY
jgi:gamma-glutamyltranspeptidase/glutathione hydrolase